MPTGGGEWVTRLLDADGINSRAGDAQMDVEGVLPGLRGGLGPGAHKTSTHTMSECTRQRAQTDGQVMKQGAYGA